MQKSDRKRELEENIKICGCPACPFYVEIEIEDEYEEEYQGHCDLSRRDIPSYIISRPRWCRLRKRKNEED